MQFTNTLRSVVESEVKSNELDPKEDLVHSEIDLPENAPEEYKDRATLWKSVEAFEKQKNSQLTRIFNCHLFCFI
ncbi:MAG: MobA/MobL family protein [Eubacterium sp.]|nr:MobA/MobL family protein [Eubacterium sp.]